MSVRERGGSFEVRWLSNGKKKSRTFRYRAHAEAFDKKVKHAKAGHVVAKHLRQLGAADFGQHVYVVEADGKVKIGVARDFPERFKNLQTGSPIPLRAVWQIACADAQTLEAALHQRYAAHRHHGEWFDAAPVLADLDALASLGPMRISAAESTRRAQDAPVQPSSVKNEAI